MDKRKYITKRRKERKMKIYNSEEKVIKSVIENNNFGIIDNGGEPCIIFTAMSISEDYLKRKVIKIKELLLDESHIQSLSDESINKVKVVLSDLEQMIENKNINKKELYTYTYEGFKLTFPELAKHLNLK